LTFEQPRMVYDHDGRGRFRAEGRLIIRSAHIPARKAAHRTIWMLGARHRLLHLSSRVTAPSNLSQRRGGHRRSLASLLRVSTTPAERPLATSARMGSVAEEHTQQWRTILRSAESPAPLRIRRKGQTGLNDESGPCLKPDRHESQRLQRNGNGAPIMQLKPEQTSVMEAARHLGF